MRWIRLVFSGMALAIGGSCADHPSALEPSVPADTEADLSPEISVLAGPATAASGEFEALVDFSTLGLTPRGRNCRLEVAGRLVFTGTIEGDAVGVTSALVFASCEEVLSTPPGTFADVFRSELEFQGLVNGEPAQATVLYQGRVQPGGAIEGRILLSRGVQGVLDVDARVAVGGSYEGSVVVR